MFVKDEYGWVYKVLKKFKDGSLLLKPVVSRSIAEEVIQDVSEIVSKTMKTLPRWIDYCYSIKVAKFVIVYADEAKYFEVVKTEPVDEDDN